MSPRVCCLLLAFAVAAPVTRADSSPPAPKEMPKPKPVREPLAPDERIEWEVDVELPKAISKHQILRALSGLNRAALHAQVMGTGKKGWQLLVYTEEERFKRFAVVMELFGRMRGITVEKLRELEKITRDAARALGGTARVPRSPESAVATSQALAKMDHDCTMKLWLIVASPSAMDPSRVRAALTPLGWTTGEENKLVWKDRGAVLGGEEQLTAGPFGLPDRWAFNMTVPRARDPVAIFEHLRESVEAVAKSFGGSISQLKTPYDPNALRAQVKSVSACVQGAGFDLGEGAVLRMF